MPRCAIYARYSSDLQSASSTEDQARACCALAGQKGLTVGQVYADDAISGSTPLGQRPAGARLLEDARAGRFDVLVVEALDRISRSPADAMGALELLAFLRVRVVTVDGFDSAAGGAMLLGGVKAVVAGQFLADLRAKTHRGLVGRFDRGFSAGGRTYGYRTEPVLGPGGAPAGSRILIDEPAAEVVRWIFDRVGADGWPARRVVAELNRRGTPAPRGGTWAVSGVYGTPDRGIGILNNPLYVGRLIWNRTQWVKDPATGRRTWRERPRAEWLEQDRPDLRIVTDAQWSAVRARVGRPALEEPGTGRRGGRPPRTLFGGLLRCGACGGPMAAINGRQYGCVARKDRGPTVCTGVTVPREAADARLLSVVRDEVLSPEAIIEAQRAIEAMLAERRRAAASGDQARRRRLAEVEQEIGRVVDAIASVGVSPALAARLKAAEAERAQLQAAAPAQTANVERAAAAALAAYREMRLRLDDALNADRDRARTILAHLIGRVTLQQEGAQIWAELQERDRRLAVSNGEAVSNEGCGGRI